MCNEDFKSAAIGCYLLCSAQNSHFVLSRENDSIVLALSFHPKFEAPIEIEFISSHLRWSLDSLKTVPDFGRSPSIELLAKTRAIKGESSNRFCLERVANCLSIVPTHSRLCEVFQVAFDGFSLAVEFLLISDRPSEERRAAQ
jgi:hypothetical protein